jgi:hypothetical protein
VPNKLSSRAFLAVVRCCTVMCSRPVMKSGPQLTRLMRYRMSGRPAGPMPQLPERHYSQLRTPAWLRHPSCDKRYAALVEILHRDPGHTPAPRTSLQEMTIMTANTSRKLGRRHTHGVTAAGTAILSALES